MDYDLHDVYNCYVKLIYITIDNLVLKRLEIVNLNNDFSVILSFCFS